MLVVGLCLLTLLALLAGCTLPGVPFSYNDMPRDGTSTTHLRRATSGIMNASLSPSSDLESRAQKQLPPEVYGYYAGAAGVGATLAANLAAFDRLRLRPDALTGTLDALRRENGEASKGTPRAMGALGSRHARAAHHSGDR